MRMRMKTRADEAERRRSIHVSPSAVTESGPLHPTAFDRIEEGMHNKHANLDSVNGLVSMQVLHNGLSDVDDVEPFGLNDAACLAEIRDVLRKHGAEDRFGIALLHRHFELVPGEVLLERCDPATRTLVTRPVKADSLRDADVLSTVWISDGSSAQACQRICPRDASGRHQGWKDHDGGDD